MHEESVSLEVLLSLILSLIFLLTVIALLSYKSLDRKLRAGMALSDLIVESQIAG